MESNILKAIINLINNPCYELHEAFKNRNRVNNMGEALEEYIKDLFAGTFEVDDEQKRLEKRSEVFSYLGNTSNPPDAMLRNGDAIEVKKIENNNSALALNSSYPKHKLYSKSSMISFACKNAEEWEEKDIIYSVGVVEKNKLKTLCFVYGLDYCASEETYVRVKTNIKNGVESIPGVEFTKTKELGKINKVDPLGITYLRVRGMWGIENPWKVFEYIYKRDFNKNFNFMALINKEKYEEFKREDKIKLEKVAEENQKIKITKVKIKNPNNPAILNEAYLITYSE